MWAWLEGWVWAWLEGWLGVVKAGQVSEGWCGRGQMAGWAWSRLGRYQRAGVGVVRGLGMGVVRAGQVTEASSLVSEGGPWV